IQDLESLFGNLPECGLQRLLWLVRLCPPLLKETLLVKPIPERWSPPSPSQNFLNMWRSAPYPVLELRVDHNRSRSVLGPAVLCQSSLDLRFNFSCRRVRSTTIPIKHNQSMI